MEFPSSLSGRFTFGAWLFLRLLALVHLIAFVSFWVQLDGLIGPRGLLPAGDYFARAREVWGAGAYVRVPSLCWIFGTGSFLHVLCAAGVVLALLLFAGVAPLLCLALLWAAYLSLNSAGQIFFHFQWDALLLEATVCALFIAPWRWLPLWRPHAPRTFGRLLIFWLLFRLMFLGGIVKLLSEDPLWRNLTALTVHFETQPLPTPLAWQVHQLPAWWHRFACGAMFAIELGVPFLLFASRRLRHLAALLLAGLMLAVALTGNYTFFNLLAIALCLFCVDDRGWARVLPAAARERFGIAAELPARRLTVRAQIAAVGAGAIFAYTGFKVAAMFFPRIGAPPLAAFIEPTNTLNHYGLFAVMTNPRPELIFEGSADGREWRAYEFRHKPGALTRRPTWVAPHQPRLDWQLWFAALGAPRQNPWVLSLCEHLLRGTPDVLGLLAHNPFPEKPPRFVRVARYEYHFTEPDVRARTGQWWRRSFLDFYVGPASLR